MWWYNGRLELGLIGEGTGKLITNGNSIDIKWFKDSRESNILL